MSFNKCIFQGNLTASPELKQTPSGTSVCSFSIAVNRKFAKQGEQSVDYVNIVAWGSTGEFVSRYFIKGSPILVCGRLQTRSWTDNQGQKRYATEIVADEVTFCTSKSDNGGNVSTPRSNGYTPTAYGGNANNFEEVDTDSSLPF